jgi:hypothetical protein
MAEHRPEVSPTPTAQEDVIRGVKTTKNTLQHQHLGAQLKSFPGIEFDSADHYRLRQVRFPTFPARLATRPLETTSLPNSGVTSLNGGIDRVFSGQLQGWEVMIAI